jgi:hypothetical protein
MKKFFKLNTINFIIKGERIELPINGNETGNKDIDEATKKWKRTNTLDDENYQKFYKVN